MRDYNKQNTALMFLLNMLIELNLRKHKLLLLLPINYSFCPREGFKNEKHRKLP